MNIQKLSLQNLPKKIENKILNYLDKRSQYALCQTSQYYCKLFLKTFTLSVGNAEARLSNLFIHLPITLRVIPLGSRLIVCDSKWQASIKGIIGSFKQLRTDSLNKRIDQNTTGPIQIQKGELKNIKTLHVVNPSQLAEIKKNLGDEIFNNLESIIIHEIPKDQHFPLILPEKLKSLKVKKIDCEIDADNCWPELNDLEALEVEVINARFFMPIVPKLKHLKFGDIRQKVWYQHESYGFPNLETLEVGYIFHEFYLPRAPKLKYLKLGDIYNSLAYPYPYSIPSSSKPDYPNLETIEMGHINYSIYINMAPQLKRLKLGNIKASVGFQLTADMHRGMDWPDCGFPELESLETGDIEATSRPNGSFDIPKAPKLKYIKLGSCRRPVTFPWLSSLESLEMGYIGSPLTLRDAPLLKTIKLGNSSAVPITFHCSAFKTLESLEMGYICGPLTLCDAPLLKTIKLGGISSSITFPESGYSNLEYLEAGYICGPLTLCEAPLLKTIKLDDCSSPITFPESGYSNLEFLEMGYLTGSYILSAKTTNLKYIKLGNCSDSVSFPSIEFPNLEYLEMGSMEKPFTLAVAPKLRTLNLNNNYTHLVTFPKSGYPNLEYFEIGDVYQPFSLPINALNLKHIKLGSISAPVMYSESEYPNLESFEAAGIHTPLDLPIAPRLKSLKFEGICDIVTSPKSGYPNLKSLETGNLIELFTIPLNALKLTTIHFGIIRVLPNFPESEYPNLQKITIAEFGIEVNSQECLNQLSLLKTNLYIENK